MQMKDANRLLRLLVENEMFRLTVWNNPLNDVKRLVEPYGSMERLMVEVSPLDQRKDAANSWKRMRG